MSFDVMPSLSRFFDRSPDVAPESQAASIADAESKTRNNAQSASAGDRFESFSGSGLFDRMASKAPTDSPTDPPTAVAPNGEDCGCPEETTAIVATLDDQKKPEENTLYKIGEYLYQTDDEGRVLCASGKLHLEKGVRSAYYQKKVGDSGYWTDDGGHLFGAQFGGSGYPLNMLPQHWGLNRGEGSAWKFEIEEKLAGYLEEGHDVWLKVQPVYDATPDDSIEEIRPEAYAVQYKVDDGEKSWTVSHYLYNTLDGKPETSATVEASKRDLRKPEPNQIYQVGNLTYYTDDQSRVSRVRGTLSLDTQKDSYYYRRKIGREGISGDEGAHLIDRRFGGISKPINLIPLNKELNRSDDGRWNKVENQIEEALENGREVNVDFVLRYGEGDDRRPEEILTTYGLDKASYQRTIKNEEPEIKKAKKS